MTCIRTAGPTSLPGCGDHPPVDSEWTLEGFLDRLDGWIAQEHPPDNVVLVVTHWLLSRFDDPYLGMQREPGFDNLWFGPVPESEHGQGQVAVCSYWIQESTRTVRCDNIATLNLPV
jgi:hypothetical protein